MGRMRVRAMAIADFDASRYRTDERQIPIPTLQDIADFATSPANVVYRSDLRAAK